MEPEALPAGGHLPMCPPPAPNSHRAPPDGGRLDLRANWRLEDGGCRAGLGPRRGGGTGGARRAAQKQIPRVFLQEEAWQAWEGPEHARVVTLGGSPRVRVGSTWAGSREGPRATGRV